jgi:hypothetical protein
MWLLEVGMLLQKEFHPIIKEMVMIMDAFSSTYLVKQIFLDITAYVGIFFFLDLDNVCKNEAHS